MRASSRWGGGHHQGRAGQGGHLQDRGWGKEVIKVGSGARRHHQGRGRGKEVIIKVGGGARRSSSR